MTATKSRTTAQQTKVGSNPALAFRNTPWSNAMSGGHFDYSQHYLTDIANEIDAIIRRNNIKDSWGHVQCYSDQTIQRMRDTAVMLRRVAMMVHRIDYLVSGDDGEGTFHKRWEVENHGQ
jgi:hypothetical protein